MRHAPAMSDIEQSLADLRTETDAKNWRAFVDLAGKVAGVESLQAELSRMRTALGNASCPHPASGRPADDTVKGCQESGNCGCDLGAAIAERALTAGKDWSYCTSRGHEIGSQCEDAADCAKNGCALGRALTAGSGNE